MAAKTPEEKARIVRNLEEILDGDLWEDIQNMSREEVHEALRAEGIDPEGLASGILAQVEARLQNREKP